MLHLVIPGVFNINNSTALVKRNRSAYHMAGKYSMSPGFKVTRIGLARFEYSVVLELG